MTPLLWVYVAGVVVAQVGSGLLFRCEEWGDVDGADYIGAFLVSFVWPIAVGAAITIGGIPYLIARIGRKR